MATRTRIRLRPALEEDAHRIFELSNEASVRAVSLNPKPIDWESHLTWFNAKITSNDCLYLIAEDATGTFIGQARIDKPHSQRAFFSLSITEAQRGHSYGAKLISQACRRSGLNEVYAYICPSNAASQRSFAKAGFIRLALEELPQGSFECWYWQRPVYIIAEVSANHNGDKELVKRMIQSAQECGADAVKIQTYTADSLTIDCKNEHFRIAGGTLWDDQYLYELYKEAAMPYEWYGELSAYAQEVGIDFFSTPFDAAGADFLETHNAPIYKIASFEAIDLPFIKHVASKGKPLIISTGICSQEEVGDIITTCREVGNEDITLLKCTSAYPARPQDMNLLTIPAMQKFGVRIGLSDHSMHSETCVAAVALGARVIEKHFTLDRALGGPDAEFSLTPQELAELVHAVRLTEQLLGKVSYSVNENNRRFARSLFVIEDMEAGDEFTTANLRSIRPGNGCAPKHLPALLGKRATCAIKRGTPMQLNVAQ